MPHSVVSKHLQATTELTVIMPVKPGFIDAMESMTYATRLRRLMMALNGLRQASREAVELKPLSDAVERIQTLQSFRLALLNNDTQLLLAVAFDGPWEPYIRKVWYDMGPLLDVIVCNCEDYPLAHECSFAEYAAWIRRYQVESQFFYTGTDLTPADFTYLREAERNQRETADPVARDQLAARQVIAKPETRAAAIAASHPLALLQQGLTALAVLDSLREIYPDGTRDGDILLRATHEVLLELKNANTRRLVPPALRAQFEPQLQWFEQPRQRRRVPPPQPVALPTDDIQGGILNRYPDVHCGALLLFRVVDPAQARRFIGALPVTSEEGGSKDSGVFYNLALTLHGLKRLGVADSDLALFPAEFLQGMEARAGLLGDVRDNHPSRWRLPRKNWPGTTTPEGAEHGAEVPLSTVDFVVQLRTAKTCRTRGHDIIGNRQHPLHGAVSKLSNADGVELLTVETMASYERGHFGFVDGISQPVTHSRKRPKHWSDVVAPGELVLGYPNDRDLLGADEVRVDSLQQNGTFMVIRKIQQNVEALQDFLDRQQQTLAAHKLSADDLLARMLGRQPDGKPLVPARGENDFTYDSDPDGSLCPLQSHIRRTNPRSPALGKPKDALPIPRIVRRGMSFGPPVGAGDGQRGLVFIAYNASIANQFEVIQRWATGANASGTYSGLADPFMGVPEQGSKRTFRCLSPGGEVLRFDMDNSDTDQRPFTELLWGMYLFVPSLSAIRQLISPRALQPNSNLQLGEQWLARLRAVEEAQGPVAASAAWKAALEDASAAKAGITAAVWRAIRERHGALRTPYGVLVGRQDLVDQVLADDKTFSVCGYADRMRHSLGPIYLGMDSGEHYTQQSATTNAAIAAVTEKQGFDLARQFTLEKITHCKRLAGGGTATLSLTWIVDQVLADLSRYWFDLPDGTFILAGGKPAPNAKTLHCPYHFTAPSRYIFSPNPGSFATDAGEDAGSRLRLAAIDFVKTMRRRKTALNGSISKPMFAAINDDVQLAQNLIGAMMGFLPTAMGLFLKTFYQWMDDDSLPRLQQDFHRLIKTVSYANSKKVVLPAMMIAMQKAPVPYMIWRTTTRPCTLGGIDLHRDHNNAPVADKIVIGISSVTQGKLLDGELDVCPIFGGDRRKAPHPTHACPGQPLAMGVLLGMVTALLEGDTLKASGLPLVLKC